MKKKKRGKNVITYILIFFCTVFMSCRVLALYLSKDEFITSKIRKKKNIVYIYIILNQCGFCCGEEKQKAKNKNL